MANSILAKMAVQISANTAEFNKGIKSAESTLQSFQKNVQTIGSSIGIAFGVREISQFILEGNKIAGTFEGVKRAFDKLPESVRLMNSLTQATHGTVGELELMQQSLRAKNFGISVKDLATYLEFATIRAQQTGESVDYMVNSIILGLGRGSIKILDNLQVNIAKIKETVKETGVSLQEAFKQQVLEQMQTIGGYAETSATAVERLTVAFKDLRLAASQAIENKGGVNWVAKQTQYLADILRAQFVESGGAVGPMQFLENLEAIEKRRERINAATQKADDLIKKESGSIQQRTDYIQQEINTMQELIGKRNDELAVLKERKKVLEEQKKTATLDNINTIKRELKQVTDAISGIEDNRAVTIETQKLLQERLKAISKEVDDRKALAAQGETEKKIQEELNLLREIAVEQTIAERGETNKQIAVLEEKLKKLREVGMLTKEQLKDNIQNAAKFIVPKDPGNDPINLVTKEEEWASAIIDYANLVAASVGDTTGAVQQDIINMFQSIPETLNQVKDETINISGLIASGVTDLFSSLENIGKGKQFGKSIIASVASFAQQFGGLLIATGIGEIAFKKFSGPQMIAAGAALVALGGAVKGAISGRPNLSGGGSSSGGSSYNRPSVNSNYQNYSLSTSVSGTNLNIILGNQNNRDTYTKPQWR